MGVGRSIAGRRRRAGSRVELSAAELELRRPLWLALSRLWLDVELDAQEFDAVARAMAASGLEDTELEGVFFDEVAPVVEGNLAQPAGVWDGFDPEWLAANIAGRRGRRRGAVGRGLFGRLRRRRWRRLWEQLSAARGRLAD